MTDDLVNRLREVAIEKQSEAWGRVDGGQDFLISAMLAEEWADRIVELEAERDLATVALMHLERCAQVVSERGAVTGPQWMRLTKAILKARSALRKLPNPAPSNEPRLVQSEANLAVLTGAKP